MLKTVFENCKNKYSGIDTNATMIDSILTLLYSTYIHVFVTVDRMTRNDRGVIRTSSPESETQMAVKVGNNMLAEVHVLQCDCQRMQGAEQEE